LILPRAVIKIAEGSRETVAAMLQWFPMMSAGWQSAGWSVMIFP
jgi:hypothetical protein